MNFDTDVIGFDVETQGTKPEYALQPWRATDKTAWISAVAFTRGDSTQGMLYPPTATIQAVISKACDAGLYVCGWNVAFDCAWLIALGLEELAFRVRWLDPMLLWRHLVVEPEGDDVPATKRKRYSLEVAMHEFFPAESGFKEFKDFQTQDKEQLKLLLHRCKEDTRFAVRLGELFWAQLTTDQQRAALIEARCIPQVAWANVHGISSSAEHAETLRSHLKHTEADLRTALIEAAPEIEGVNLGSPKQLVELVYSTWGLPITRMTKGTKTNPGGNPSTDKYALYELAFIDPRARLLKEVREAKNNCTKYAEATLKSLEYNGDGRVRPQAKIFSTYSSRMTYASDQKRRGDKELKEKAERYQTGVALHQWKRGKDFRRLIRVPDGYTMAELDFAGQEFRWMAVASGDGRMLELCQPGEDAHTYMGSQIAGVDYHELIQMVKAGDEHAALSRKMGKFCIAEGEMVLTDRGLVPIEKVSLADRVWDGVMWVRHDGVVYQGEREVITYAGLTATPDHRVYLEDGSDCEFGTAASEGYCIAQTGDGRKAVRVMDREFYRCAESRKRDQGAVPVCLRNREMALYAEPSAGQVYDVQGLCDKAAAREDGPRDHQRGHDAPRTETMQCYEAAMRKSERSVIQELRCEGDSVSVSECVGRHTVCAGVSASSDVSEAGFGSSEQRWPLCTRKFETCDSWGELEQQKNESLCDVQWSADSTRACVSCTEDDSSGCKVCPFDCEWVGVQGADHRADRGSVSQSPKLQTKRTYDITNAGPNHRFTVSNYLVFNCNLSFQYRIGFKSALTKARTDYELDVTEDQIKQFLATYKTTYIGVSGGSSGRGGYWTHQVQKCRMLGYAETFAGRRVQLRGNWSGRDAWSLESTSINYPIQGSGGDQKYLALAVARTLLPKYNGYFYYELHDGLFFIFPHAVARQAAEEFKRVLSNLPYKQAWGINLPIKFPVDCKISDLSWGDLHDL